jgi:hypothetical protein
MRTAVVIACAVCASSAACTNGPANVMGTYTGTITRGDNGCNLQDWTLGEVVDDVVLDVTQDGTEVIMTTSGSEVAMLDAIVSGHSFVGSVSDTSLNVVILGTRVRTQNTCKLRLDAVITATVSGSHLDGEFHFRETAVDPACLFLNDAGQVVQGVMGCDSIANISLSR